jgi:ferritin-like metal-binding protein YciE
MEQEDYLHDIQTRIVRVTEDLRAIQRELNCAAMQAPTDPELMETLTQLPEMESLQVLKSALDQMRHFLWFYLQVMTNESEAGERLRQTIRQKPAVDAALTGEASLLEKFKCATDTALLRFLSEGKARKPD